MATQQSKAAQLIETQFKVPLANGYVRSYDVTMAMTDKTIEFIKAPYDLKDTIKQMQGARWNGYLEKNPRKTWSVANSPRNHFRIARLRGEKVYAWWDRPVEDWRPKLPKDLLPQQYAMVSDLMTYHYVILAAEMGMGKTRSAIEAIRLTNPEKVVWVCPANLIASTKREFDRWGMPTDNIYFTSYDTLSNLMSTHAWDIHNVPQMLFVDEATHAKNPDSKRAVALQELSNLIRYRWGYDGFVVPMTGTPSPHGALDIWSLCEITCPGFIQEGSPKALEQTLCIMREGQKVDGTFKERVGWKDSINRCEVCGLLKSEGAHDVIDNPAESHTFVPCKNEIERFSRRIKGLVKVYFLKDWMELPEYLEEKEYCAPSRELLAAAKTIANQTLSSMETMSVLRQLSDGFMYREEPTGKKLSCPSCTEGKVRTYSANGEVAGERDCYRCKGSGQIDEMERVAKRIPCPKDDLLRGDLERCWDRGRIVVAAPHKATVDRCTDICLQEGWDVVRMDGRGMVYITNTGEKSSGDSRTFCLDAWEEQEEKKIAWVCNIESGAMGLNLQKANLLVIFSNSFKSHYRTQLLKRIHRPGSTDTCYVRDYIHLPSDERALEIVQSNRNLELMTLGEILEGTDLYGA